MRQADVTTPPRAPAPPRWPSLLANEHDLARLRAGRHSDLAARVQAPPRTPSQTPVQSSYDARLMRLHAQAAAPRPSTPAPLGAGVLAAPITTRPRAVAHWLFVAAGAVVGALLVFPVAPLPSNACPPAGEGQISCLLTKSWLPAATKVALIVLAAHLLARIVLDWIPQAVVRHRRNAVSAPRRGRTAAERRPALAPPPDPLLTAASWGRPGPRA
jgi:hypothetical protein